MISAHPRPVTHILCTGSRCGEICSSPRMREMHNQNCSAVPFIACWARGSHCPSNFLHVLIQYSTYSIQCGGGRNISASPSVRGGGLPPKMRRGFQPSVWLVSIFTRGVPPKRSLEGGRNPKKHPPPAAPHRPGPRLVSACIQSSR